MDNELLQKQNQLQTKAKEVIEKLQLIQILSKYGQVQLVGSVVLGLMTWKDIDIEVIVENLNKIIIAEVMRQIMEKSERRLDFAFIDNGDTFDPRNPTGMYLNIKYFGYELKQEELFGKNENIWKIDIWFVLPNAARSLEKTETIKRQLTTEKQNAILEIKNILASHPKYRKEIFSTDIYTAVLEKGVSNIDEFKKYLNETGKNI